MGEATFGGSGSHEASFGGSGYKRPKENALSYQQILALTLAAKQSHRRSFLGAMLHGGGHGLMWGFEQLLRPSYGVAEGTRRSLEGKGFDPGDFARGFERGFRLKDRTTFSDVLKQEGVLKGHGRLRAITGGVLDVVTDPTLPLQVGATIASGGTLAPELIAGRIALREAADVTASVAARKAAAKEAEKVFAEHGDRFGANKALAKFRSQMADREALKKAGKFDGPILNDKEAGTYALAEEEAQREFKREGTQVLQARYKIPFTAKNIPLTPTALGGKRIAPKAFTLERAAQGEGIVAKLPGVKQAAMHVGKTFRHGFLDDWEKMQLQAAHMGEQYFDQYTGHAAATLGQVLKENKRLDNTVEQLKTLEWANNREHLINPADRSINESELQAAVDRKAIDQGQADFIKAWHQHTEFLRARDKLFDVRYDKEHPRNKLYIPHVYEQHGMPLRSSAVSVPGFTRKKVADLTPAEILRIHELQKSGDRTLGTMEKNLITNPMEILGIRTRRGAQAHARENVLHFMRAAAGVPSKVVDYQKLGKWEAELQHAKEVMDLHAWVYNDKKRFAFHMKEGKKVAAEYKRRVKNVNAKYSALRAGVNFAENPKTGEIRVLTGKKMVGHIPGWKVYKAKTIAAGQGELAARRVGLDMPTRIKAGLYRSSVPGHVIEKAVPGKGVYVTAHGRAKLRMFKRKGWHAYNLVDKKTGDIHGSIIYGTDKKETFVDMVHVAEGYDNYNALKELFSFPVSHGKPLTGIALTTTKKGAASEKMVRFVERINKRLSEPLKPSEILGEGEHRKLIRAHLRALERQKKWLEDEKARVLTRKGEKMQTAINASEAAKKNFDRAAKKLEKLPKKKNPNIPDGWEQLKRKIGGEYYHFDPETNRAMSRVATAMRSDEEMAKLATTAHKLMAKWKLAVTSVNPGYRIRNTLSDMWNMYISGVPTWAIAKYGARASKVYKDAQTAQRELIAAAAEKRLPNLTAKQAHAVDMFLEASTRGVMSGLFQGDIQLVSRIISKGGAHGLRRGKTLAQEGHLLSAYTHIMQDFNRHVENWGRFSHYLYRREAEKLAPSEAADWVKKAHFDYSELTPTEREKFRKVIPFYTWSRKNIPYQLTQMFAHPGRMATFPKFVRTSGEVATGGQESPTNEGLMPSWLSQKWAFQVPFFGKNAYMTPMIGVGDLARLGDNPLNEALSMAGPWVKMPFEIATGRSTFTGNEINTGRREPIGGPAAAILGRIPGNPFDVGKTARTPHGQRVEGQGVNPWVKYIAGQVPMAQEFLQLGSPIDKARRGQAGPLSLRDLAYATGLPIYERDPETEAVIAKLQNADQLKKLLKRLRDEGKIPPAKRAKKQTQFQQQLMRTLNG